ncbi:MAG: hypothetical protein HFG80_03965 [Eubacterium sp.]|jgi:hypothetical protein|nr:hypothetical protein [Eubacterium sp.]
MEKDQLLLELETLEKQGITIWLSNCRSNSKAVTDAIGVNEENMYMRDYIFEEGVLKELRFDRICPFI